MAKIAIVDDEKEILETLERFLVRFSEYSISTYENPASAISSIQNGGYDLVLLDIMMPQMNGLDFLEKIKASNPNIKVIMMTAYDTLDKSLTAHRKGANNYLKKPFNSLAEVKEKIEKALR